MALTKYRLDSLLRESDERNHEGCYEIEDVKGISIQKVFIETKANMDGVSLKPYKLVKPDSFAYVTVTSRNGEKITIAHNDGDDVYIVSSSYVVFEVARPDILDSRYLFMYFNRPEFDRYARFNSWGSARETFSWEDMCDIEIDLPDIDTQRKYVAIYRAMLENQRCYEQGLDDLKLACDAECDAIKQSSAPKKNLGDFVVEVDNRNTESVCSTAHGINLSKEFMPSVASSDDLLKYKLVQPGQIACNLLHVGRDGAYPIAINATDVPIAVSPAYFVFETTSNLDPMFLMGWFSRDEVGRNGWFICDDSIRGSLSIDRFKEIEIPVPSKKIQSALASMRTAYKDRWLLNEKLKAQLKSLCPILIKGSVEEAAK